MVNIKFTKKVKKKKKKKEATLSLSLKGIYWPIITWAKSTNKTKYKGTIYPWLYLLGMVASLNTFEDGMEKDFPHIF